MTAKSRKQQIQEMLAEEPTDAFLRYGLAMEFVSEANDADAVREFRELFAVAIGFVSEARSNTVSGVMGVSTGCTLREP